MPGNCKRGSENSTSVSMANWRSTMSRMVLRAAASGFGLACVLDDQTEAMVAEGRLVRVLEDWCPPFAGYHLYYPSRRQPSAAFSLLVDALRRRR